jgi:hypothetical protein
MAIGRVTAWMLGAALCAPVVAVAAPATGPGTPAIIGLAEIVERNAAARGGLDAWRKVQTMAWSGHVERADGAGPRLPFLFEQRRPNLTRFEIAADQQRSVRVFDGQQGWKLRPSASGRPELQPYGEDEQRAARDALVIDGPVLDAQAKGIELTLEGMDEVEGRKAFRLNARLPSGTIQSVWIDAQTFLEIRYERPGRDSAGRPTTAAVYLRDYQAFEGLQIPFTIETRGGPIADRLVIERVELNPALPDGSFARPGSRGSRRGIAVDTRSATAATGERGQVPR